MSAHAGISEHRMLCCHELYLQPPEHLELLASMHSAHPPWCPGVDAAIDAVLIHAAATDAIAWCIDAGLSPSLVYIDPPYASHRDYVFTQTHPADGSRVARVAFGDRWDGGMDAYIDMLRPIIRSEEHTSELQSRGHL